MWSLTIITTEQQNESRTYEALAHSTRELDISGCKTRTQARLRCECVLLSSQQYCNDGGFSNDVQHVTGDMCVGIFGHNTVCSDTA